MEVLEVITQSLWGWLPQVRQPLTILLFCLPPPLPASYLEPVTHCLAFLFDLRHPAENVWLFLQLILSGILSDIF